MTGVEIRVGNVCNFPTREYSHSGNACTQQPGYTNTNLRVGRIFYAAAKSGVCIAKWPPAGGADSSKPKLDLAA